MPDRKNVLLVEDDERLLGILAEVLGAADYTVDAVNTGQLACSKKITRYKYAVIDFRLPDINGIDLAYYMQKQNPEICIIMITGHVLEEHADELARNKWKLLKKPFMASLLLEELRRSEESWFGGSACLP